jgi:hypothetical protein
MTDLENARYCLDILVDNLREGSPQPVDGRTVNRAHCLTEILRIIVNHQSRVADTTPQNPHMTTFEVREQYEEKLVVGPPITATEIKERTKAFLADKKSPLADLTEAFAYAAAYNTNDALYRAFAEDSTKGLKLVTRLRVDGLTPTGRNSGNSTSKPIKEKTNEQR